MKCSERAFLTKCSETNAHSNNSEQNIDRENKDFGIRFLNKNKTFHMFSTIITNKLCYQNACPHPLELDLIVLNIAFIRQEFYS